MVDVSDMFNSIHEKRKCQISDTGIWKYVKYYFFFILFLNYVLKASAAKELKKIRSESGGKSRDVWDVNISK